MTSYSIAAESFLTQRDIVLQGVRATAVAVLSDDILLSNLNFQDDARFDQLMDLTMSANQMHRTATEHIWSTWPCGMWASICEATLLGPFVSHEEAMVHLRLLPRSCFGAISWQVGVPPERLMIG